MRTARVTPVGSFNPTGANAKGYTVFNGELYFAADDGITGVELWKVKADGTALEVVDINPGAASSNPLGFTAYNGALYFQASASADGAELYKVNAAGSVSLVADINPGPHSSNPAGFLLFPFSLARIFFKLKREVDLLHVP